jgi:hypothetical protein
LDSFKLFFTSEVYVPEWAKELLEKSLIVNTEERANVDDLLLISFLFLLVFVINLC